MEIVVLDGYTLNPGDLTWDEIAAQGSLQVYDRTASDQIMERIGNAEIVFTNKTPLTKEVFEKAPNIKFVGVLATGYNVVDIEAARDNNVIVSNIPTYGTQSVAQMVFALLLELCQHVQLHSDAVKNGEWSRSEDFCFWKTPLIELADKVIGIVGLGRIGTQVAKIAAAFGMKVLAMDAKIEAGRRSDGIEMVDMDDLLKNADVVSLHCPLFPETQGIINKASLSKMKDSAFLINTSRGPLVVEKDLTEALDNGVIAGAALDVLSIEPPEENNPLYKAKNCIITPHISWATKEARERLMHIAATNLEVFIAGKPVNIVNR